MSQTGTKWKLKLIKIKIWFEKFFLNSTFNIFKACFSHGIGGSLLMTCLGHVGSLKLNLKSNTNWI